MHILMVTTPLPSPGRPTSLAPLAAQIETLRQLGLKVSVLEVRGRTQLKYLWGIRKLRQRLAGVDIVHGHHGYCGWVARCQGACPVVVSFMGADTLGMPHRGFAVATFYRAVAWANRWLAKWSDAAIVKSGEMKTALKFKDAHVIPNGVDTDLFRPLPKRSARTALRWVEDQTYVLFGGHPDDAIKNFPLAREAVRIAQAQLGKPLNLIPLRHVNHHLVPQYMNACDVMLVTSYQEGSPNVIKEAMACNLPIVSTPVGDVPWLFEDASGYRICRPKAHDLAKGLVEILTDDNLLLDGSKVITEKQLTLKKSSTDVLEVYNHIMQSRH